MCSSDLSYVVKVKAINANGPGTEATSQDYLFATTALSLSLSETTTAGGTTAKVLVSNLDSSQTYNWRVLNADGSELASYSESATAHSNGIFQLSSLTPGNLYLFEISAADSSTSRSMIALTPFKVADSPKIGRAHV